jgi:hypothetical protein
MRVKRAKGERYTLNPFNSEPRIRLIDKEDGLIRMVSQIEAFHLLRHGFCELLMVKPPTIQFQLERAEWDNRYLRQRPPKWFRDGSRYLEARKSVLYGNFHIQAPDGHEMFHCNAQKALWYLNRDIADVISNDPPTLRLKFSPGGPGHIGDVYYLTPKVNQCVVCASTKDLNRHHVMPRVFRRYMPECIKDHNYHDVLLMCIDCHERYEVEAAKLKQEICKEFGFDINDGGGQIYLPEVGNAVKAARALLHYGHEIPEPRKSILLNTVKEYLKDLNVIEVTKEDLEEVASHFPWKRPEGGQKNYGEYVVEKIGDIQVFTERWRRHFLEVMNPQYLPEYWDIHKPLVRDRVRTKQPSNPDGYKEFAVAHTRLSPEELASIFAGNEAN